MIFYDEHGSKHNISNSKLYLCIPELSYQQKSIVAVCCQVSDQLINLSETLQEHNNK